MKTMSLIVGFIAVALFSGCSASHYSIHHTEQLNSNRSAIISVDAKQRFLLSTVSNVNEDDDKSKTENIRRFCAEPSPDVFSVLSQAASGSGSFGQTSNPQNINIALQAAFSSAEAGSTISRTQTVNMLKEMMYRTCERYINGQIGDYEYPIIAARDQRIMTSILAIEQLTGTVMPKPSVIAATGNSSTGQSTEDAIRSLERANKNVFEKKNQVETVQKEFDKTDDPKGTCDTLMAKDKNETNETNKVNECTEKKSNKDTAEKELKDAETYYEALVSLAGKPGNSSATTSAVLLSSAAPTDKQMEQARLETIRQVADTVENIVTKSFNRDDETSFFCYRALQQKLDNNLSMYCRNFLMAKMENEYDRLYSESLEMLVSNNEKSFEIFWEKIKNEMGNEIDKNKLQNIIDRLNPNPLSSLRKKLDEMTKGKEKEKVKSIYMTLRIQDMLKLLKI